MGMGGNRNSEFAIAHLLTETSHSRHIIIIILESMNQVRKRTKSLMDWTRNGLTPPTFHILL